MRNAGVAALALMLFAACGPDGRDPPDPTEEPDAGGIEDGGDEPDAGGEPDAGDSCGPTTCNGCCSDGVCVAGGSAEACGTGGAACAACGDAACIDHRCELVVDPLEGDTCETPIVLALNGDGFAAARVELAGRADDTASSCGAGGADLVVAFDVEVANSWVELTARSSDSGVSPSFAIRTDCGRRQSETSCVAATSGSGTVTRASRLAAGRFYAWIETSGTPTSPLDLELRVSPPDFGDSCAAPKTLPLTNGSATTRASLLPFGADRMLCDAPSRDVVFDVLLSARSEVRVTVTPRAQFAAVIELAATCDGTGSCVPGAVGEAQTARATLNAGHAYVTVAAASGTPGEFDLTVTTSPAPVESSCDTATALTFNASGQASASFLPANRRDTFALACDYGSSGADGAFTFNVPTRRDFSASVREQGELSLFDRLALRNTCTGQDIACGNAIEIPDLEPGNYVLLVDASSVQRDPLTVVAQLSDARPAGETCGRAITLPLTNGAAGGTARVTGSFAGATDDIPGTYSCGSYRIPELVYTFTIDRELLLSATSARTGATGSLAVTLGDVEACPGGYGDCTAGATTNHRVLLAPGKHFLTVQGDNAAGFTLDVALTPPPEGESCSNPIPLVLPAGGGTRTHQATTIGSTQENNNNACIGYDRPDRVYALTLTDPMSNLRITSTPRGSNNAPAIQLMDECRNILELHESCSPATAATRTLSVSAVPAGTYAVWVKGPTIPGTDYTLEVTATPTRDGEVCDVALPITLSNGAAGGTATVQGNTTGFVDDLMSCNQISPAFPDVVYTFTTDRELDMRARMTPTGSARGALSIANESCRADTPCTTADTTGVANLKSVLPAGTHFLSVDHSGGGPGAYTLELDLGPHRVGETCENPKALAFSSGAAGGSASATVDLRDFIDDEENDCYGSGADAFYAFTTDRVLDLRVNVQTATPTGTPKFGLMQACGPTSCDPIYASNGQFARGSLPPGNWILFVDVEYPRDEGPMTLQATLSPPTPGDTCANPIDLGIAGTGGSAEVTGSLANAFSEHSGICGSSYADRVYRFTTTRALNVVAEARNASGAKAPGLKLVGAACEGTQLTCHTGKGSETFVRQAGLAAGTYHLVVERSDYNAPEDYTLKVSLGDRPTGDSCTNAVPLDLPANGPGLVTVRGDTRRAFHDVTAKCGASTGTRDAPDVAYSFTLQQPMNVRLSTHAVTSGFRPTVSLKRTCEAADADMPCAWTPSGSADTWTSQQNLAAGIYYVIVDGYDRDHAGEFDLTVRTSPANPAGESCANPKALTLSSGNSGRATVSGSFADYFDDLSDCWNNDGSDIVFAVTTDRARRLHARVTTPVREAGPTVSVRKSPCAQSSSQVACQRPAFDGTGRVSADIAAGTSYVVVKSPLANPQGTFDLAVDVDDFVPGDVCSGALPLAFTNGAAGGTASATLDAYAFGPDVTMSCDSNTGSPDAYFTFTTDRTLNFSASLVRQDTSATFAMALYPGCSGTERACKNSGFTSQPVTLTSSALPAGTWILAVRGGTSSPSGFTVNASLSP